LNGDGNIIWRLGALEGLLESGKTKKKSTAKQVTVLQTYKLESDNKINSGTKIIKWEIY
jgi:hypothetical protein